MGKRLYYLKNGKPPPFTKNCNIACAIWVAIAIAQMAGAATK